MLFKCIAKDIFIKSLRLYLDTYIANINKQVLNLQAGVQTKMELQIKMEVLVNYKTKSFVRGNNGIKSKHIFCVYVFLSLSMYSYRCLCILIVVYVFLLLSMYS